MASRPDRAHNTAHKAESRLRLSDSITDSDRSGLHLDDLPARVSPRSVNRIGGARPAAPSPDEIQLVNPAEHGLSAGAAKLDSLPGRHRRAGADAAELAPAAAAQPRGIIRGSRRRRWITSNKLR
jgi:hypothetical protein